MTILKDFVSTYGVTILYAILTAIAGYLGVIVKNIYAKYVNDKTKRDVVNTCVNAVEQLYKDLHGEDKLNKCIESASEILIEKGINITDLELRMLIEASVQEFNKKFGEVSKTAE